MYMPDVGVEYHQKEEEDHQDLKQEDPGEADIVPLSPAAVRYTLNPQLLAESQATMLDAVLPELFERYDLDQRLLPRHLTHISLCLSSESFWCVSQWHFEFNRGDPHAYRECHRNTQSNFLPERSRF